MTNSYFILAVPICPEVSSGLSIPRQPAEIQFGTGLDVINGIARVVDSTGVDVTDAFICGAQHLKTSKTAWSHTCSFKI